LEQQAPQTWHLKENGLSFFRSKTSAVEKPA
jgi:hypothetical protein